LDVGCGRGLLAIGAARRLKTGKVTGIDVWNPQELSGNSADAAKENAKTEGVADRVRFESGYARKLVYPENHFDAVISANALHTLADDQEREQALREMLRVLKPGGTIAFSTWPPELMTGRMFRLVASYMPPLPPGVSPPPQWGDEKIVRERLGSAVRDITFERGTMQSPALSPQHFRALTERTAGPVVKLVENFTANDPAKLAAFRAEYDALAAEYFHDNFMQQEFLMTRAVKN